MQFKQKILLGITGGIAAYKSAELLRLLIQAGHEVQVVMTATAKAFVQPLTFQSLSGRPVYSEWRDAETIGGIGHIELARWPDRILIAPATADFVARVSTGLADDLLTTICLASEAPIMLAPAMNRAMWLNPATRDNVATLRQRGYQILGPDSGDQACGETGPGRMRSPEALLEAMTCKDGILKGKKVLITAGPTLEPIDPVRYLSNHSSGKMGYALAEAAIHAGAEVTLISGPVNLSAPFGLHAMHRVQTAIEMHSCVMALVDTMDLFIGTAAVADYTCEDPSRHKIKKSGETLTLILQRTPDILAQVAHKAQKGLYIVGFAAETESVENNAHEKRLAKKVHMMIANQVGGPTGGFASDDNQVTALWASGEMTFPLMPKVDLARALIQLIAGQYHAQYPN